MAYNVYSSNPPPFRAAQTGGPGFPPPSPGAGGNRGFSPTPKRSRSGGGKWVWIVLIVAAVLLFRSGVIRRILNGAQELADSVFEGAQSITNTEVKPSGQKPGSGMQPLITETVTVGDSALVSYRDAALDYREDGLALRHGRHGAVYPVLRIRIGLQPAARQDAYRPSAAQDGLLRAVCAA